MQSSNTIYQSQGSVHIAHARLVQCPTDVTDSVYVDYHLLFTEIKQILSCLEVVYPLEYLTLLALSQHM